MLDVLFIFIPTVAIKLRKLNVGCYFREAARDKKKLTSFIKLNALGEKILWFKNNLNPEVEHYSSAMIAELIEK